MFGTFPGDACQKPLPAQGSRAHGSVGPRGAMGILSGVVRRVSTCEPVREGRPTKAAHVTRTQQGRRQDRMSSAAIVLVDREGFIRYWNEAATSLFGYPAREAVGQSLDLVVPPPYRAQHWAGFTRTMTESAALVDGGAINLPVLCKDGVERTFRARFLFLRDAQGRSAGAVALYSPPAETERPSSPVSPDPPRSP